MERNWAYLSFRIQTHGFVAGKGSASLLRKAFEAVTFLGNDRLFGPLVVTRCLDKDSGSWLDPGQGQVSFGMMNCSSGE